MVMPYFNNARQTGAILWGAGQATLHAVHQSLQHSYPMYSHSIYSTSSSPTPYLPSYPASIPWNPWYVTSPLELMHHTWMY
ncbi:hypothetical protein [Ectobacillus panaciterrae]|uniref:hypothetical protein n=1 Tax=Ectobacillus panaciterrae TaxID=363872 RepID=UPI0012DE9C2C|nr:hypothetical protein [Ectobacillus panaciterrae]